jgi:hypothetical protein
MKPFATFVTIIAVSIAAKVYAEDSSHFRVQAPDGMKAVVTQNGDLVDIQFVQKNAVTAPAADKPKVEATASPKPKLTGATSPEEQLAKETKDLSEGLDRPIAAIPAFTALDLSPESVAHPASPRDLGAALLNGVDRHGVLQSGLALETAVFRLVPGWKQDFPHYASNDWAGYWTRFFYNFSLSLATAKATAEKEDKSVNLALGLQAVLWQDKESDPLRSSDLEDKFLSVGLDPTSIPISGEYTPSPQTLEAQKKFQVAVEEFRQKHWVGTLWTASIAPTWHSESGAADDLQTRGFTAWSTFAYAFDGPFANKKARFQAIAQFRYRQDEMVVDPNDTKHEANQDTLLAATRLRFGSPDFNGFAEGAYIRVWHGLNGDEDGWRGAIGLEKKIAKNVWLVLSAGQQFGGGTIEGDELFVLSSLRFGTADKAQFKQ